MNIYLASSARNPNWERVKTLFEQDGHTVFDWKTGFTYGTGVLANIDVDSVPVDLVPKWAREKSTMGQLTHDLGGIASADALVLLLPAGADAHTELGLALGLGVPCFVLAPDKNLRASLFYCMARWIGSDPAELCRVLRRLDPNMERIDA